MTDYLVRGMTMDGFVKIGVYADRLFEEPRPGEQRIYFKARKGMKK